MADPRDLAVELLLRASPARKLPSDRLVKMLYLVDWKHSIDYGFQATNLQWFADSLGPFDTQLPGLVEKLPNLFAIHQLSDTVEDSPVEIECIDHTYSPRLIDSERKAVDHILKVTSGKTWPQIVRLVFATFPMMSKHRYSSLNLPELAVEYKKFKQELANREGRAATS